MVKVLHVMEHSFPKLAGYTIRSKYIVDNQRRTGIDPVVITSPLQGRTDQAVEKFEEIDDIRYYRTGVHNTLNMDEPLFLRLLRRYAYSKKYLQAIRQVAAKEGAGVVHAHSSYLNGVRANQAAKSLGLLSVYEVRGLWQDTAAVNADIDPSHWKYKFVSHMDRKAILGADRVVTISSHLMREIADMGVAEDRLYVVPNGVDTGIFRPTEKDADLVEKYNLENMIVFGFIGSIRKIEGLALFLENLNKLVHKHPHVRTLLIGSGDEVDRLKEITRRNNIENHVIFTGRVPHEQILKYYSVVDIFLYPRIDAKVNHKVTPLKPLEAMAMEKAVIASNVGGLKELVQDDKNGVLFNVDDGDHLVKRCFDLIEHPEFMSELGKQARQWTVAERDWREIVKLYARVYAVSDVRR